MSISNEILGIVPTDSELKEYQSLSAISEVLGCLMLSPNLITQYSFEQEDFTETLHKIILASISGMQKAGYNVISALDIDDWLSAYPTHHKIFENHRGFEYVESAVKTCSKENFIANYNMVKKWSLLRALKKNGVDVSEFFVPNAISGGNRDLVAMRRKRFEQASTTDILNFYRVRLFALDDRYNGINGRDKLKPGGQGAIDHMEYLKKHHDVGLSYTSKYLTGITYGIRKKRLCISSAGSGTGKAIPDYSIIPTPSGYKKVGEIVPGDYLFGDDGKPTKVLMIHPQEEEKEIWEVHFKDGRVVECCGEHLWEFYTEGHRGITPKVKTTKEWYDYINEHGERRREGYRVANKINEPVQYSEKKYSIDPYVMGAFLGDGSFRMNPGCRQLVFSSATDEIPKKVCDLSEMFYKKNHDKNYSYEFKSNNDINHKITVDEFLEDYPELINKYSYEKFIPEDYKIGSIQQRIDLINGLLDTDGTVDKKGRIRFTTTSEKLLKDFIEVCNSLGMMVFTREDKRPKYTTGICYECHILCTQEMQAKLFTLKRKVEKNIAYLNNGKRKNHNKYNPIVSIEKTNKKTSMTCFTVDNDSHLFLCNDYIVTHNTRMALANICYSFSPRYWSPEEQKWMKNPNGTQNRALYIGTEMELREEIEPILMAYIAGVPQDHITKGEYEPGEEDRLREAAHILEKSHIYLEYMPDYDLASLENIIEKYNAPPYNVDHVFFDYIHTTTNLIAEFQQQSTSKMQIREDQVLANVGLKLKEMTRKYNISIDTATQVSANFQKSDARDETVIRGAKSLADKADICYILSRPTKKELDALNPLINKGGFGDDVGLAPNRCISVYKNRSGTYTNVKIWLYVDMSTMRVKDLFTTDYQNVGTPLPKMQSKINEDGEIEQFSLVAAEADDEMNKVDLTEEDKKMVILGNYSESNELDNGPNNIEEIYDNIDADTDTLYNAPIVDPDTGEVLESLETDIEDEYYEEPINSDESLAKIEKEQEQEKDDSIMDGFHRIVNNDDDEFSNFFF